MIDYAELQDLELVGVGAFSQVFRASWRHTPVAVKVLTGMALHPAAVQELHEEAGLMLSIRHPNCTALLGLCTSPAAIVMEYCTMGSLFDLLQCAASTPAEEAQLTWERRLRMAIDAATGMLYLHSGAEPMLHRDLRSPNLLVAEGYRVKVADFSLSARLEAGSRLSAGRGTNVFWQAPELLEMRQATRATDVYAFGIILAELLTLRTPFHNMSEYRVAGYVLDGGRPVVPPLDELPGPDTAQFAGMEAYIELMQECWAQQPEERPSFEQIVPRLKLLLEVAPGPPPRVPLPAQEPAQAPAPVLLPSLGSATKECRICANEFPLFQLRVLVPCGHNPCCEACSQQLVQRLKPCPLCRAEIERVQQVFYC